MTVARSREDIQKKVQEIKALPEGSECNGPYYGGRWYTVWKDEYGVVKSQIRSRTGQLGRIVTEYDPTRPEDGSPGPESVASLFRF